MEDTIKNESPVITKISLMRSPEDFHNNSISSSSHTTLEPMKQDPERLNSVQQDPRLTDNPRVLLLLLHQKDLEIKALKTASRGQPPDRLACILQELVRTRQKGPLKNQAEAVLREEIERLNCEMEAIKENHTKEIQMLQEILMRSQLRTSQQQDEVKTMSLKAEHGSSTGSSMSLDEGVKLAFESFELWSETGKKLLIDNSDLRLRRIPKHTSFVDAFHKFGTSIFSDEDSEEKVISTTDSGYTQDLVGVQISQESSKTKESGSDPSSSAVLTSQKSEVISTMADTKTTESSSSLPSLMEKLHQRVSISMSHLSSFSLGQPSVRRPTWIPTPFKEEYKRDSITISPLKIVSVHRNGKFVRILNSSSNKEVDLSGYIIQQWVGGHPVSIYRFPVGTVLPALHHITVWAAGANLAQKQSSNTLLSPQGFFKAGPECTTILCNCSGQTVSQYTAPHRFTAAAEAYNDNVDLSVDKFPLIDDKEETLVSSWPSKEESALTAQTLQKEMADSFTRVPKPRYTLPLPIDTSGSTVLLVPPKAAKRRISDTNNQPSTLSLKSNSYLLDKETSSSEEEYFPSQTWKTPFEEPKVREFKTTLDTTLPMVTLVTQKSARSKYGFRYMTYAPTTTDLHLRRYY